jgi:hypothetical protein
MDSRDHTSDSGYVHGHNMSDKSPEKETDRIFSLFFVGIKDICSWADDIIYRMGKM